MATSARTVIDALCERLSLSRPALAKLVGVKPRSLHRWWSGESRPTGVGAMVLEELHRVTKDPRLVRHLRPLAATAVNDRDGLPFLIGRLVECFATLGELRA